MERTINSHRGKSFLFALASLAFVFMGIWMFSADINTGLALSLRISGLYYPIAVLEILFFSFCFLYYLYCFLFGKQLYVVNKQGFTFKKRFTKKDLFVPWQDVKTISKICMVGQSFIVLNVRNEKKYIHSGFYDKAFAKGLTITTNASDIKEKELIDILSKYAKLS